MTPEQQAAMRQALEALEDKRDGITSLMQMQDAITALRQALEQPAGEPVAYSVGRTLYWHEGRGVNDAQLYTRPKQCNCVQTAAPQRSEDKKQWVGLTDEEYEAVAAKTLFPVEYGRAIEAKLRSKNHG